MIELQDSPTASEESTFIALAEQYRLCGRSFLELCDHNASVAQEHGKLQVGGLLNYCHEV
jgi:hypothetical protein